MSRAPIKTVEIVIRPRTCCMKCTAPLSAAQIAVKTTWCVTCNWLLRHERHATPKVRPSREELLAIGHPIPDYSARQQFEPVPFDLLPVEHWPEVD